MEEDSERNTMPTTAPQWSSHETIWHPEFIRRTFSEPQLFSARRLMARSDAHLEAAIEAGKLLVTYRGPAATFYGSATLAGLSGRSREVTTHCSCAEPQPCVHVVAGYLLGSAQARGCAPADVVLELLGAMPGPGQVEAGAPARATAKSLRDLRAWLSECPVRPGQVAHFLRGAPYRVVLEANDSNDALLARLQVTAVRDGQNRLLPLAVAATEPGIEPAIRRACSLLLAAGVGGADPWGPEATPALLALAAAGLAYVAGDSRSLTPGPPIQATVRWDLVGAEYRLALDARLPIRFVVDADPPLYISADAELGELTGLGAREWNWLRKAPPVPVANAPAFSAAVGANPGVASVLPPLPVMGEERVPAGQFQPILRLTGQGSTARAVLAFEYGRVVVDAPDLATECRQPVEGRWLVAVRDRERENACVEKLRAAGLRQAGNVWRFYVEAHFAHSTQAQWLRLQKGLFADLEFDDDWRVEVDPDFGFARSVIAQKETAEATRRFNRKRQ